LGGRAACIDPLTLRQARPGRGSRRDRRALARFVDPEHEYSAVAKAIVDPVLEELTA
jgi:hypothetical protein